jgi:DNA-binding response OmpR family regulator
MVKRILIIDDDEALLNVLNEALQYEGFEVKAMLYTDDIFALIKKFSPDLIVLDFILNGINGGELCHQIKHNNQTSFIPIIICSAYSRVIQSLGDYGCDAFISKPFDLNHFTSKIYELISINSLNNTLWPPLTHLT